MRCDSISSSEESGIFAALNAPIWPIGECSQVLLMETSAELPTSVVFKVAASHQHAPLAALIPANANPADLSIISKRNGANRGARSKLFRREEYIDDAGATSRTSPSMNFTINVLLNNDSSITNIGADQYPNSVHVPCRHGAIPLVRSR